MPTHSRTQQASPTPSSTEHGRRDSVAQDARMENRPVKMLKIYNLLNPETSQSCDSSPASSPATPSYTPIASTPASTPRLDSPATASPPVKRAKLTKDAAVFVRGTPQGDVNYEPFECNSEPLCLTSSQSNELARQHGLFQVYPNGEGEAGCIRDYVRHIPYSSERKTFFANTGREAFEVFQYTFIVPGGDGRAHTVMWDYQIGLVRITPFFKSFGGFNKTTPARALGASRGLKDLSHSITGGALAAQGYWVPYACARAMCLTFAYDIRWALTPIFGHSFVKDCLRPDHPDFKSFKIEDEVIRNAQREAEGWKSATSRSATPESSSTYGALQAPRPLPPTSAPWTEKTAKCRKERPEFKQGSPFGSETKRFGQYQADDYADSPSLSPKSSPTAVSTPVSSGWASINRPRVVVPSPPTNTSVHGFPTHTLGLLIEPRSEPMHNQASWRDLNGSPAPSTKDDFMSNDSNNHHRAQKRSARELDEDYADDADEEMDTSVSTSVSSDSVPNIITSPPPSPVHHLAPRSILAPKRVRLTPSGETEQSLHLVANEAATSASQSPAKSTIVSPRDVRAAQWLLSLHEDDAQLARGPTPAEKEAGRRLDKGKARAEMV